MKSVRFSDIAREADVGTATVERVLNARGNVRPETVQRVIVAARKLGYDRRLPAAHFGIIRIEVILMRPDTPFFTRLNKAFAEIAATLDSSIVIHRTFLDELAPQGIARHIAAPGFRRAGLIIVAPDHPEVKARLSELRAAKVVVVQIVSSTGVEADFFIGIDNYAAGRTAAYYMAKMLKGTPGSFVALAHGSGYQVHRDRIRGFSDYLAEHATQGHLFERVMFGLDDRRLSDKALTTALQARPDIIGIYNSGGANSGIAAALERRSGGRHIMWIGHELTDNSRRWLTTGLMDIVLDQAPEIQARRAVDVVLHRLGFMDTEIQMGPVQFLTITRENL